MQEPKWLSLFKENLAHNHAFTNASQPIILRESYAKVKNDHLIDSGNFAKTDLLANALKEHQTIEEELFALEQEFAEKAEANPDRVLNDSELGVVIDQALLKTHNANYHLVLLDASKDYCANYYPIAAQILADHNIKEKDFNNIGVPATFYLTWPSLRALVFINDQGQYFLAMPAISNNRDYLKTKMPVIETKLKTVSQLLKPMPLIKVINRSKNNLKGPKWLKQLSGGYLCQLQCNNITENMIFYGDQYNEDNALRQAASHSWIWQQDNQIHDPLDKIPNNELISEISQDRYFSYLNCFAETLKNNLQIKFAENGDLKLQFVPTKNHYWHKLLNKTIMPKIRLNLFNYGLPVPSVTDLRHVDYINMRQNHEKHMPCQVWEYLITYAYNGKLEKNLVMPKQTGKTQVIDVPVKANHSLQQLRQSTGLNQVLTSLKPGRDHKYYVNDDMLITLYGDSKINGFQGGRY